MLATRMLLLILLHMLALVANSSSSPTKAALQTQKQGSLWPSADSMSSNAPPLMRSETAQTSPQGAEPQGQPAMHDHRVVEISSGADYAPMIRSISAGTSSSHAGYTKRASPSRATAATPETHISTATTASLDRGSPHTPAVFPRSAVGELMTRLVAFVGSSFSSLSTTADSPKGASSDADIPGRRSDRNAGGQQTDQKKVTLLSIALVFLASLALGCLLIVSYIGSYQLRCEKPSFSTFYAKKDSTTLTCKTGDSADFLRTFNHRPTNVRLRILGWRTNQNIFWRCIWGRPPRAAAMINVALDLSPYLADQSCISDVDASAVQRYLASSNPLDVLVIRRHIEWASLSQVTEDIRYRLRALGFAGQLQVEFEAIADNVRIYQGHPWACFLRDRAMQALGVISVIGGFVWLPYLWFSQNVVHVDARFQVNLSMENYYDVLKDRLGEAEGCVPPQH